MINVSSFWLRALILSSIPALIQGIWKCDDKAGNDGESPGSGPCNRGAWNEMSTDDRQLLQRAVELDARAEQKYFFECKNPKEIMAEVEANELLEGRGGMQKCVAETEGAHLDIFPGIDKFALGYNIVTDSYSSATAHTVILNIISTSQYEATAYGSGHVCYRVPDAFCTSESIGAHYDETYTGKFESIGANSTNSHREQEINSRSVEVSLDITVPGAVTVSSGFSQSQTTSKLKQLETGENQDVSTAFYYYAPTNVHIHSAKPTLAIVGEWKKLYAENTKEAYYKYFDEYGTHYYVSGVLGGKLTVQFSTRKTVEKSTNSNAEKRATCVTGKISGTYSGVTVGASSSACTDSFKEDAENKTLDQIATSLSVHCQGGNVLKCPTSVDGKDRFEEWRDTVKDSPVILQGSRRWIPQLIEHVLSRSKLGGVDGNMFKIAIAKFTQDTYDDAEPDLEDAKANLPNNSIPFEEFGSLLSSHLINYLTDRSYCNLSPDNCPKIYPMFRIEGISKAPWGKWHNEQVCPHGQIVKGFTRYIERSYLMGDATGLNKIGMRCSLWPGIRKGTPGKWTTVCSLWPGIRKWTLENGRLSVVYGLA